MICILCRMQRQISTKRGFTMSVIDKCFESVEGAIKRFETQTVLADEVPQLYADFCVPLRSLHGLNEPLLVGRLRELAEKTNVHFFRVVLMAVANDIARQRVTS